MKTVYILKEPVHALEDDINAAMARHVRDAGMVPRLIDNLPQMEKHQPGDILLAMGWRSEVFDVARARDSGQALKVAVYLLEPSGADAVHRAAILYAPKAWQVDFERGVMACADLVAVPTQHALDVLGTVHDFNRQDVQVVGGFFDERPLLHARGKYDKGWEPRRLRVLHPFGAQGDAPQEFERLKEAYAEAYPDDEVEWVNSFGRLNTREELLEEMARCRVVFTARMTETWPTDLIAASYMGAWPVVPDRLCYPELMPGMVYSEEDEGDVVRAVHARLHSDQRCAPIAGSFASLGKALEAL